MKSGEGNTWEAPSAADYFVYNIFMAINKVIDMSQIIRYLIHRIQVSLQYHYRQFPKAGS